MKIALVATALILMTGPASAQAYAANGAYRVCAADQTDQGQRVVQEQCGELHRPDFGGLKFGTLAELEAARIRREGFTSEVSAYNRCVSAFINSYRRPGAPANSVAPDQAACAHSWAEDQATQAVREYGKACVDYSNRSMIDRKLTPFSGDCYPTAGSKHG